MSHANTLSQATSPYLLQHAGNPVHWQEWGPEAIERAKIEDKPIFLSIGYSTCHWCHVMEHESFESEEIAEILNEHFVSIKVDREERPDVDATYMNYVQMRTGSGGWPLSVFLTPELKPFFGGTYFPPDERYGRAGFGQVLKQLANLWETRRDLVVEEGQQVTEIMQKHLDERATAGEEGQLPSAEVFHTCYGQLRDSYDEDLGGFGGAPKFPRPVSLNFMLTMAAAPSLLKGQQPNAGEEALTMVVDTLKAMIRGGMHDQLGGGFHRYSVDAFWHVPHFEKMLYDQAQIVNALIDAWKLTHDDELLTAARRTLRYCQGPLAGPDGSFFSAEDADSLPHADAAKKKEGAFYVWTYDELDSLLDEQALNIFTATYGVKENGNAPPEGDPQGEFRGENILYHEARPADVAAQLGLKTAEVEESLEASRQTLMEHRERRPRPHLDDKILTSWNALMISALSRTARATGETEWLEAAIAAATFLEKNLYDDLSGTLHRSYREGKAAIEGFAADYAFLIQGLLDLYEASLDRHWLTWAEDLQATMTSRFTDHEHGGFFLSPEDQEHSILKIRDEYDGAEPSPNSIAALNLLRLSRLRDGAEKPYHTQAEKLLSSFQKSLTKAPITVPQMAVALAHAHLPSAELVLAGGKSRQLLNALNWAVGDVFVPHLAVLALADEGDVEFFESTHKAARDMFEQCREESVATAFLCRDFACEAPVTEAEDLAKALQNVVKSPN